MNVNEGNTQTQTNKQTNKYMSINGQIALRLPSYMKPQQGPKRQFHPKSNTYKYSFIARTMTDWNSLPANVIDQATLETFKTASVAHFSNISD